MRIYGLILNADNIKKNMGGISSGISILRGNVFFDDEHLPEGIHIEFKQRQIYRQDMRKPSEYYNLNKYQKHLTNIFLKSVGFLFPLCNRYGI